MGSHAERGSYRFSFFTPTLDHYLDNGFNQNYQVTSPNSSDYNITFLSVV